jgi:hypothetical protein
MARSSIYHQYTYGSLFSLRTNAKESVFDRYTKTLRNEGILTYYNSLQLVNEFKSVY